jgi:ribosomal protein S18 acetylase RimI-like enzyme
MRKASLEDVPRLVTLMVEFYAESSYPLNRQRAAEAFSALIQDSRLGQVWLIEARSETGGEADNPLSAHDVGYLVVTLGFSMEYGGRDAFVDDLFIQAAFRGRGLGTAALAEARAFCIEHGVRAVHLEVARDNAPAQAAYRRAGFADTDRQLLTLRLADPTHVG